jgi:hypothetical protein
MRLDGPHRPDRGELDGDDGLLAAVLAALRRSGYRALWHLHCEVRGGVVAVSGVVPSYHLKQVTQTAILRLPRVSGVRNLVEVQRPRAETNG